MAQNAGEEVMQREVDGYGPSGRWSDLLVTQNQTNQQEQQQQTTVSDYYKMQQSSNRVAFHSQNKNVKSEQQLFGNMRRVAPQTNSDQNSHQQDFRSSNANRSDTAHFNDASCVISNLNEQMSGNRTPQLTSEENQGDMMKGQIRYQGNHIPPSKQKPVLQSHNRDTLNSVDPSPHSNMNKQSSQHVRNLTRGVLDDEEEEMIDEIIETDPDEEEPHPVDDHILDSKNDDIGSSTSGFVSHSMKPLDMKHQPIDDSKYRFFNDEHDEDLINQSVDRINPQEIQRSSQNLKQSSDQQYFQLGAHANPTQQRPQHTYHSYKSSISSPSVVQLEGGSKQDNESVILDSSNNQNNEMRNNFRFAPTQIRTMNGRLSSAKKRPSDTQSRGERRLLSANASRSSPTGTNDGKQNQTKQFAENVIAQPNNGQRREDSNQNINNGGVSSNFGHSSQQPQQQQMSYQQGANPVNMIQGGVAGGPMINNNSQYSSHQQVAMMMSSGGGTTVVHQNSNPQQQQQFQQTQVVHHPSRSNQQQMFLHNQQQMMRANYQQQQNWFHQQAAAQQHQMIRQQQFNSSGQYQRGWTPDNKQKLVPYFRPQHPQAYQYGYMYQPPQAHQYKPTNHQVSMDFTGRRHNGGFVGTPSAHIYQSYQQGSHLQGIAGIIGEGQASQISVGLGPRSINDTNVDQFSRFILQQSHLKPTSHLTDRMRDRVKIDQKLLLVPIKESKKSGRSYEHIDTDSKTEDAEFSRQIDRDSPIKIGDSDLPIIDEEGNSPDPPIAQSQTAKQQPSVTNLEVISRMENQRADNEIEIDKLKKGAIQAKKEWRQKRLTQYKKQCQMDEDQELIMIMNNNQNKQQMEQHMARSGNSPISYNGSPLQYNMNSPITYNHMKVSDSAEHQKFDENEGQNYNPYGQNNRDDQMYGSAMRPQNQDIINLEQNLQMQQEQEKRQKRQQSKLQEQQLRRSMSSMKAQLTDVIPEEQSENISNTYRGSENNASQEDIQVEGEQGENDFIRDETKNQAQSQFVDNKSQSIHLGEKGRKSQQTQANTFTSMVPATAQQVPEQSTKKQSDKQQQQQVSPRSPPIQCLEVDEIEFCKIQQLIDPEQPKIFDSEQQKKLNKDLEEIESKKYLEAEEIQDQIQELLDQKTDEVKQQISNAEKKQIQKMSYQMLFQDSFYSQKGENAADQAEMESPGIKTEQVLKSQEQSVGEIVEPEKDEQQNEKLIEFQQQLEKLQKMTSNLNEFVERGNYQESGRGTANQSLQEIKEENHKRTEIEQKDNLESQAQQSQLFDKSTVHTLKEDKNNMRLEETQSEHGVNGGIINIKTNKLNFKKSQSMRKKPATNTKNIKIKRAKLKRVNKTKNTGGGRDSKIVQQPLFIERRATGHIDGRAARMMLRNSNQPKKSHSLDSMQINAGNYSIVSPNYAPIGQNEFNTNPAAIYPMSRVNVDQNVMNQLYKKKISFRELQNQQQLQFMGGQPKTKWRSNSPKKGDIKLIRRSSYSPVHQQTPIYYELHQSINQKGPGSHTRDFRSARKIPKSAHPSLIYLKGQPQSNGNIRYQQVVSNNHTPKNMTLKKIKLKKLQSALEPTSKKQGNMKDTRIMIRTIQSPQAHLMYNRHQDNMMAVGAYQRMQGNAGGRQVIQGNIPMITQHHLLRSATSRIDSANSYFANSAISSQQKPPSAVADVYQKGLIKPIQVYNVPPQIMGPEAQSRSQMLPSMQQQAGVNQKRQAQIDAQVKSQVRMAPNAMSGPGNVVPPLPPRQQRGNDLKNATLGGSGNSGLLQGAQSQNTMMDNQFIQRHKSAKSAVRSNALYNPLMPGQQQTAQTGQQIDYQFTSSRSVFDRMAQVKGAQSGVPQQQQAYQTQQSLAKPLSSSLQRYDSNQRQMNSTIMATAPASNQMSIMDQQNQPKNMYIRYKNQVDDKYYNPHLMSVGGYQSVGQLVANSAPQLQHSQSANVLQAQSGAFVQKPSPYQQKLRMPRSGQSRRASQAQMMPGVAVQGNTTQLIQMTGNPHARVNHINATQRMQGSFNSGQQIRQQNIQKHPMTIRYKQYQMAQRNSNQGSYPILHMDGLV